MLLYRALCPTAVLPAPVVLENRALCPKAMFPSVLPRGGYIVNQHGHLCHNPPRKHLPPQPPRFPYDTLCGLPSFFAHGVGGDGRCSYNTYGFRARTYFSTAIRSLLISISVLFVLMLDVFVLMLDVFVPISALFVLMLERVLEKHRLPLIFNMQLQLVVAEPDLPVHTPIILLCCNILFHGCGGDARLTS